MEFRISCLVTFSDILPLSRDSPVVTGGGNRSNRENHRLTPSHWQLSHMARLGFEPGVICVKLAQSDMPWLPMDLVQELLKGKRYLVYSLVSTEALTRPSSPSSPAHTVTILIPRRIFQSSW